MTTLMQASHQWASRPDDERFLSLLDLNEHCQRVREQSYATVIDTRLIEAKGVPGDNTGLVVVGETGEEATPTHWAFNQLADRAGASGAKEYLRTLASPLVADCLNYSLRFNREIEEIGVLVQRQDGDTTLRAVTGPGYGRVWNATITEALVGRFGDGITGDFRVPGEFGKAVQVTKQNTTLYASDRDIFVFLADEKNRIEVPGRRDGKPGSLARGFFVWNSEVGGKSYGIGMFLFDFVCCNRIVWGAEEYTEIRGVHSASAPSKWLEKIAPAIEAYANASAEPIKAVIESAQKKKVDDIDKFLKERKFTKSQITGIKQVHLAEEGRPMESLWDVTTGITAFARLLPHQDARVELERAGGEVFGLAA